ncbi:unnamed protein product, partial [marine sediment metagenome]
MTLLELRALLDECDEVLASLAGDLKTVTRTKQRNHINEDIKTIKRWKVETAAEIERQEGLIALAGNPRNASPATFVPPNVNTRGGGKNPWQALERSEELSEADAKAVALDCIERDETANQATGEHATAIVSSLDRDTALYVAAVSDPVYARAF